MRYFIIRCYLDNGHYITETEHCDSLENALSAAAIYVACPSMEAVTIRDETKDPTTLAYTIMSWMRD